MDCEREKKNRWICTGIAAGGYVNVIGESVSMYGSVAMNVAADIVELVKLKFPSCFALISNTIVCVCY